MFHQKISEILELLRQKHKQTQPEEWEDVTAEVHEIGVGAADISFEGGIQDSNNCVLFMRTDRWGGPYRLRKVQVAVIGNGDPTQWAFIVERKVS